MNRLLVSLAMLSLLLATLALFHRRHAPIVQGWPDHIEEISAARFWHELDLDGLTESSSVSVWRTLDGGLDSISLADAALCAGPHVTFLDTDATRIYGRPTLQNIQAYRNDRQDVWVLRQRTFDETAWRVFALVLDKTRSPSVAHFYRRDNNAFLPVTRECFTCHANGPRAIYPARFDLVAGQRYLGQINRYCRQLGFIDTFWVDRHENLGPPLALPQCATCHQVERARLYRIHERAIRTLTCRGVMPPGGRMSRQTSTQLEAWLLSGPGGD